MQGATSIMSVTDYVYYLNTLDVMSFVLFLLGFIWAGLRANHNIGKLPPLNIKLILLIGFLLRLPRLFEPLWYDEIFTGAVTSLGFDKMNIVLMSDVHPPLHYYLTWFVVHLLGNGELALRLPSLIGGMILIVAMRNLANSILEKPKGDYVAFATACMPSFLYFSGEARYPIFLALSVVIALLAIRNRYPTLIVGIAIAFPAYFHAVGLFYALALMYHARKQAQAIIWAILLMMPLAPLFIMQSGDVANGFWLQLREPLYHIIFLTAPRQTYLFVLMLPLLGYLIYYIWRSNIMPLLIWGIPLLLWLISILWHPIYLARALLPSFTLMLIPLASLMHIRRIKIVSLMVLVMTLIMYFYPHEIPDLRKLFDQCGSAPEIITTNTSMAVEGTYYQPQRHRSLAVDNGHQWLSPQAKQALGIYPPLYLPNRCVVFQRSYYTQPQEKLILQGRLIYTLRMNRFISYEVYQND